MPGYISSSHYGVTATPRDEWFQVLSEWQALKMRLQTAVLPLDLSVLLFVPIDVKDEFLRDFSRNCRKLGKLIDQLSSWVTRELETHDEISLLGI